MKFLCVECDARMTLVETQDPDAAEASRSKSVLSGEEPCGTDVSATAMSDSGKQENLRWTREAQQRMSRIPEGVRNLVQQGIESYARECGASVIDTELMEAVRVRIGL